MVVQWLRLCLPMQGVWVQSLVRELRCQVSWVAHHVHLLAKNKILKQNQCFNKIQ